MDSRPIETEAIADQARSLRELASSRSGKERVELYCKVSSRVRLARGHERGSLQVQFADESGMAVRIDSATEERSSFASVGGASAEAMRWAVDTALATGDGTRARLLRASEVEQLERLDLDVNDRLPSPDGLSEWLRENPTAEWIEAGITVEALCGEQGWLAVRRRARSWALFDRIHPSLAARREASTWMLPEAPRFGAEDEAIPGMGDRFGSIVLLPEAAAPLVTALATLFHGEGAEIGQPVGAGWRLQDDPLHPEGLAGGAFDDVGFPSERATLAADGAIVGTLCGPGTYRRPSFRDVPRSGVSTIRVLADPAFDPGPAQLARRCRVLPLEMDSWVLDMEARSARVDPRRLLSACAGAFGTPRMTGEGVLTPSLAFEGLG